jgi:hypothetical protein
LDHARVPSGHYPGGVAPDEFVALLFGLIVGANDRLDVDEFESLRLSTRQVP